MDRSYISVAKIFFMIADVTRKLTINSDGELIDLVDGNCVDYGPINNDLTIQKISNAYGDSFGDYSNELFIKIVVKKMEWQGLIRNTDDLVLTTNKGLEAQLWNDLVRTTRGGRISVLKDLKNFFKSSLLLFFSVVALPIRCIASSFLANSCKDHLDANFSIIRSDASFEKIEAVRNIFDIVMLSENIVYRNNKVSSAFNYVDKLKFVKDLPSIIHTAIFDYLALKKELSQYVSHSCAQAFMPYYAPRIVAKCCFEILLMNILEKNSANLVTGNKEDRFAMVEKRLAKKFKLKLICIPHGLEYSYRFPAGLAGDVFYCTSQKSVEVLTALYKTDAFVFDSYINKKIYGLQEFTQQHQSVEKVVFFTEPRNVEVNRKVLDLLNNIGVPFKVKLHPNDSTKNYNGYELKFVDSLADALSYPVSIARKSTILLNSAYLGNVAISVLIDSKDFFYVSYVFPSLSNTKIRKVSNNDEFKALIKELI